MHFYIVARGDSLWMIAKRFGVSLESLIKANHQIKDPNKIRVGEKVAIPLETDGGYLLYKAQSGDTMWNIAEKFGIGIGTLLEANEEIRDGDVIAVGQVIRVPLDKEENGAPEIAVNDGALYEVSSGETLWLIAHRFGIDPEVLKNANPQIRKGDCLRGGEQLYLPGSYEAAGGETLREVARRFGVEEKALASLNGDLGGTLTAGAVVMIPRRPNGDIAVYKVKKGDTLWRIAGMYGVSVEALLLRNKALRNGERIYPDQEIVIPGLHQVRKGQTLYSIAALYDLPLSALVAANAEVDPAALAVGQVIRIPDDKGELCGKRKKERDLEYAAREGDTLDDIALLYQVSAEDLRAVNPDIPDGVLPAETVLRVPTGYVRCGCYTVREGDTLWRIAARYGISAAALIEENGGRIGDEYDLIVGDVLRVPFV